MKPFRYVAVIGIDGMGSFNKDAVTPNFDRIFENGAVSYDALSLNPTISAENWGGMLLGADPVVHGLTNSRVGREVYTNSALPSLFTRIRRAMPEAYLTSCVNWDPINHGIVEHDVDVTMQTASDDETLLPMIVAEVAKKPTFLFVQFDDADGAGHRYGYGTPEHLAQIGKEDAYVGAVYDAYREAGILEDTLFTVIADHGGYDHGHGGYTDGEKFIFFGASGRGVQKGNIGYMQTKDVSAVVLAALGLPVPQTDENGYSSQVPDGLFEDYESNHRTLVMKAFEKEHKAAEDPEGENGLFRFVPRDKLAAAFLFEGNMQDAAGSLKVTERDTVKYYNMGVRGECGELGLNGHAVTSPVALPHGLTVAAWVKKDDTHRDSVVIAANRVRDCNDRYGFYLCERIQDTEFCVGSGNNSAAFTVSFPTEMESGWIHVAAAFDNENCTVRLYQNFKLIREREVPEVFKGIDYTAPLYIGEDATGCYNRENKANTIVDDLLIFNAPLTDEEIAVLGTYYGEK